MDKINDEKFISIEYERWEKYYKPLEKANELLKLELIKERESKKYSLHVHYHGVRYPFDNKNRIGYIDFSFGEDCPKLYIDRENVIPELINNMKQFLSEQNRFGDRRTFLLSEEDVNRSMEDIRIAREENKTFHDKFMRWYNNLPKLIKWAFKLKPKSDGTHT